MQLGVASTKSMKASSSAQECPSSTFVDRLRISPSAHQLPRLRRSNEIRGTICLNTQLLYVHRSCNTTGPHPLECACHLRTQRLKLRVLGPESPRGLDDNLQIGGAPSQCDPLLDLGNASDISAVGHAICQSIETQNPVPCHTIQLPGNAADGGLNHSLSASSTPP